MWELISLVLLLYKQRVWHSRNLNDFFKATQLANTLHRIESRPLYTPSKFWSIFKKSWQYIDTSVSIHCIKLHVSIYLLYIIINTQNRASKVKYWQDRLERHKNDSQTREEMTIHRIRMSYSTKSGFILVKQI